MAQAGGDLLRQSHHLGREVEAVARGCAGHFRRQAGFGGDAAGGGLDRVQRVVADGTFGVHDHETDLSAVRHNPAVVRPGAHGAIGFQRPADALDLHCEAGGAAIPGQPPEAVIAVNL